MANKHTAGGNKFAKIADKTISIERKDRRLIFVYDSCGTLVNGKPFVGMNEFKSFMDRFHYEEDSERYREVVRMKALSKCRPNGDMFLQHYFRPRPTTVFKSKVKFYSLKLKK